MGWEAVLTLVVVVGMLVALVRELAPSEVLVAGAAVGLAAFGELADAERLPNVAEVAASMGNPGLATVGVLFVVVAGLTQTRALERPTRWLIGSPKGPRAAQLRLVAPVLALSAFVNNTPVVAMFLPIVDGVSKRTGIPGSQLYLPMAYAATFGGVCTLIGTSTNLVVNGLWTKETGVQGLALFDLAWVGVPAAFVGVAVMQLLAPRLLASRKPAIDSEANLRQYSVEVRVVEGGPYEGKTVEEAGLRRLPRLYLVGIERGGEVQAPVSAKRRLFGGDVLSFVGDVDSVVDVCRYDGLAVVQPDAKSRPPSARLIEAVVSDTCPLLGTTIRDAHFRSRYDAAVVAVARGAERVTGRLGDIELRAGDTLLLEAGDDFLATHGRSRDFFLVSGVGGSEAPRSERANLALLFFGMMVLLASTGVCDLLTAGSLAAMAMVATGCCGLEQAKNSIDWSLLVTIAGALGIGAAMQQSGLAQAVAANVVGLSGGSAWGALLAVYVVAMLLTELVTNNAAAVLVYPVAVSTARSLGVSETPFVVALMVAASAGYATPFGYQTNLMVYGPGGYRFIDYVRLGVPLDLAYLVVTVALTPLVFPF